MNIKDDSPDRISDKTCMNISAMAAAGYECEIVQEGDTRSDDKFRVSLGGKVLKQKLHRKSFVSFLNKQGLNLHYSPVVEEY